MDTATSTSTHAENDAKKEELQPAQQQCPYLDTINRKVLDFDFEKLCSVSLSKINVYACLVCGHYFQGRGKMTHAYIHSCSENHHVFLNLETLKFYCLPDNYEIKDSSFDDILFVLKPTFNQQDILNLDSIKHPVLAYNGTMYYPGIVGLNNLKYNDYCNVVFQVLSHVIPLRNQFLLEQERSHGGVASQADSNRLLQQRFGELIRKLWNPRNFKAHVSPHEMLQAIVLCSNKEFEFTKQGDPIVFLSWFLNALCGPKRQRSKNIVEQTFQGKIRVHSKLVSTTNSENPPQNTQPQNNSNSNAETVSTTKFLYLTLDLPPMPLYPRDEQHEGIKPQTSLYEILKKFNGKTEREYKTYKETYMKRFEIIKLPQYLILYIKRFTKNTFFLEKNPYIVSFPIKNFDMSEYVNCSQASSFSSQEKISPAMYDLIGNISHDGSPEAGKGTYKAHILHQSTGKWFEMQDLHVTEIMPQMITLSESYIQVWRRADQSSVDHPLDNKMVIDESK